MTVDLLYIVSTLRRSGPTNQLYYLLKHLDDKYDATVLTLSPEPEDTALPRYRELGIECRSLGLSRLVGAVVGPVQLRKVVAEVDPDVIHTQGIRADTLSVLFLSSYPRVTTIRNYTYDDYPAKYGRVQGTAMAWTHLRAFRRIDHPVACSKTIARLVRPHRIDATPIQNGVDHEKYCPVSESRQRKLRKKHDLPQSDDIIVSVGSLIPRKDPLTVIRGFLASDFDDTTLVFLGDGPLREDCTRLVGSDDSVRFEGWVDDVPEYLRAADFYVSASKSEGLPNSVMEALSTGLPVCLSDIGPHRELFEEQVPGGFFATEDAAELAASLEDLRSRKRESLSNAAREVVTTSLTAEGMSSSYQSLYGSILKR